MNNSINGGHSLL